MYSNVEKALETEVGGPVEILYVSITFDVDEECYLYTCLYNLVDSDTGEVGEEDYEWTYYTSEGTYSSLESVSEEEESPYYPVIPIRVAGTYMADADEEYSSEITQACGYLGLDPDDIEDAIADDEGDNELEDAYVMLGVSVTTDSQEGLEYLYQYFLYQWGNSSVTKSDWEYYVLNQEDVTVPSMNVITMQDSNYKMKLGWLYIESSLIEGDLGDDVNYLTSSYSTNDGLVPTSDEDISYSTNSLVIKKQVDSTTYRKITIYGLVHYNWLEAMRFTQPWMMHSTMMM